MIDFDRLIDRLPSSRVLLVIVAVALVVGGAALGGWYWYGARERQAAGVYAAALAQAQSSRGAQAPGDARAASQAALERALASYPSSSMAAQGAYELGGLRYAQGQYAGARSAYEIAIARGASGTITTLARLGIGYTWEAERNLPKAVESFQAVAAGEKPSDAFHEQALLDLARVQELAGRRDDAVATYRRALKDGARSARAEEVRLRLASLGATP
jgi:tetratricopeptide (TPR) repeat protein